MEVLMARFDLSDEEWAVISGLLPKQWRGPKRKDDRENPGGIIRH
jgi:transposase